MKEVTIIGGGLAGCEAAWQAVRRGVKTRIIEMKPVKFSPAHRSASLAELVCSNALKATSLENASGLLKEEMRLLDSLIIRAAQETAVPAGSTLAVDREAFSKYITEAITEAGVELVREEMKCIPEDRPLVIATGPLTSDAFAASIKGLVGSDSLYFYDAVAPVVHADSIDMTKAFMASRYGKGSPDYINCPMDEAQYERFYRALVGGDVVEGRAFEDAAVFEGCMPIEVMAGRGIKTLLFGPMRPVGLTDPRSGARPYAVVQLRRENREGTLYNIVGFQTRLNFGAQKEVFRLIPGLEDAQFARLGKIHRNSYLDSPRVLNANQQLLTDTGIFFAGQITGVEGYCESAVSGIIAGINAARAVKGLSAVIPPRQTMTGALLSHITDTDSAPFSPMNANMGLLAPSGIRGKPADRKLAQSRRAIEAMGAWLEEKLNATSE